MAAPNDDLRMPPSAIDAERAVLGGLMLAPAALSNIDWLREEDFYPRHHRLIFRAICDLANRPGAAVDPVTMADWFDANGLGSLLEGGSSYLIDLANETPSAANIVAYAEIVAEKARLRRAIDAGVRLTEAAWRGGASSELVVADAVRELSSLQATTQRGSLEPVGSMLGGWFQGLTQRYENGDQLTGLATGFRDLDSLILGLQPGELVIVAARPNMGKSLFGGQIAVNVALAGHRTALFSMEMTRAQVLNRAVACIGRTSYRWVRNPDPSQEDPWPRVTHAMAALKGCSSDLLIDDSPALALEQLQARARRAHLQKALKLIVVDHLHEMPARAEFAASDHGRNAAGLKALGKELGCAVVALAQLNRGPTDRPNKRPGMSDLRASGALEEKADVILLIHREDYYDPNTYLKGTVEVIVGKGRDVPTGETVYLANRFDQMRMDDWDDLPPAPPPQPEQSGGFRRRSN